MKKLTVLVAVILIAGLLAGCWLFPEEKLEFEVTFNSGQNDINKAAGHPYINWTIDGECIDFEFVNPTTWFNLFDYRVDMEDGEDNLYSNILITQGELAGETCGEVFNPVETWGGETKTVHVCADEVIWVGLRQGGEQNVYIRWIIFEKKICE